MTHLPASRIPSVGCSDKTLHVAGYFVLTALFIVTARSYRLPLLRRSMTALLVLTLYALIDEATQPLVNRHCSFTDWLADLAGIGLAIGIDIALTKLTPARSSIAIKENS